MKSSLTSLAIMIVRDVPVLSTTVLKEIARQPTKYINEPSFRRALAIKQQTDSNFDILQTLVDYIIDAGRLTDDVVPATFFDPSRKSLSLKNAKVSGKYIRKVVDRCPDLIELDIGGTFQVDDQTVLYLLQHCPLLENLNVRNCRKLTDKSLEFISENGHHVKRLQIGGNFNMTAFGIHSFLKRPIASRLVDISISGLIITDDILDTMAKRCKNLTRLGLNYIDVSENAVRNLVDAVAPQLEHLSIAWIGTIVGSQHPQISAEFISQYLAKHCPRLSELDVSGLRNINYSCLLQLLDEKYQQVIYYLENFR